MLKKWNINGDSIKDGLITTAAVTGILLALKITNVKPTNASLDAKSIMELADGMLEWGICRRLCSLQKNRLKCELNCLEAWHEHQYPL